MQDQGNMAVAPVLLEPGAGSACGNGWKQLWKNFWMLLLIMVISFIIGSAVEIVHLIVEGPGIFFTESTNGAYNVVNLLYGIIIGFPLYYGVSYVFLKAARAEKMNIQNMFEAFKNYLNVIGAYLLVIIITLVGFILLIVPGIICICKLAFVPYLVVDEKMGVTKAIGTSWRMTDGYGWTVFLIGLIFLGGVAVDSVVCTIFVTIAALGGVYPLFIVGMVILGILGIILYYICGYIRRWLRSTMRSARRGSI